MRADYILLEFLVRTVYSDRNGQNLVGGPSIPDQPNTQKIAD